MTCKEWVDALVPLVTTIITVVGSVWIAANAHIKSKKIKFFETYFEKKSQAYEEFIKKTAIVNFDSFKYEEIMEAQTIVRLYANAEVCGVLDNYTGVLFVYLTEKSETITVTWNDRERAKNLAAEVAKYRKAAMNAMHDDMERCREFKFNQPLKSRWHYLFLKLRSKVFKKTTNQAASEKRQ